MGEDIVLFVMNVVMMLCYLRKLTSAMCFSAFLSLITLVTNVITLIHYVKATSRKLSQLEFRSGEGDENAEIELKRFLEHPLRRCIARCLPRTHHTKCSREQHSVEASSRTLKCSRASSDES